MTQNDGSPTATTPLGPRSLGTLSVALFVSGAAALIYQVLWVRSLSLLMGTSLEAVATVFATFMVGLGLGGLLASRRADALDEIRLVRLYAALELAIAGFALAFPVLLAALTPLFRALYAQSEPATVIARILVALLLLGLPTTAMGVTLPVLTTLRARVSSQESAGRSAGILYAANSFGAMFGSLLAGLVLLQTLSTLGANAVGIVLNLLAAAVVFRIGFTGSARSARTPADVPVLSSNGLVTSLPLLVIAMSGFAALASEVAWTRAIVLLIGPTTYGFSFIVAAVIGGIALGSAAASSWRKKHRPGLESSGYTNRSRLLPLALMQLGAALSSLLLVWIIPLLVIPVGSMVHDGVDAPGRVLMTEFIWVMALVLLPSFFFGASFPMAVDAVANKPSGEREPADSEDSVASSASSSRVGLATGRVYGWNTFGAVVGSLVAGFLLIPRMGAQGALVVSAALHLLAFGLCLVASSTSAAQGSSIRESPRATWLARGTAVAVMVCSLVLTVAPRRVLTPWDPEIMSGGLYKYSATMETGEFLDFLRRGELVHYGEDKSGTVSVKRVGTRLSLAVDGKVDATNHEDMLTQRMLAHLPILVHPNPKDVLVIGLGSGVTAGSALLHPIESLVAVEISSEVVEASRLFSEVNYRPHEDARFELRLGDGRNHLSLSEERYDVIISEPSNPWMAGVSSLFTVEFFEMSRGRLNPGGLFCQWAHIYNMSEEDLKTIVASFTDAFDDAVLFVLSESDVLLLGSESAFAPLDATSLAGRMNPAGSTDKSRVRDDLASVGIHSPAGLGDLYGTSSPRLARWVKEAERHRDHRPILEYRAARSMNADTGKTNRLMLQSLGREGEKDPRFEAMFAALSNQELLARAQILEDSGSLAWSFETYRQLLRRGEDAAQIPEAYRGLVQTGLALGDGSTLEAATTFMKELAESVAPVEARIGLALLYRNTGAIEAAKAMLGEALSRKADHREGLIFAAELAGVDGDPQAMATIARRILVGNSLDAEAAAILAETNLRRGNAELSARQSGAILSRRPKEARALQVYAISTAQLGNIDEARQAFGALIELEPEAWIHLNNYAQMELESNNFERATVLFERAVDLNPRNLTGYEGLKRASELSANRQALERAESMLAFLEE